MSHRSQVQTAPMPGTPAPGGHLVAVDGRTLPLRGTTLRAEASGGLVRVVLEQRFRNAHPDPLHVTYLLPLPVDGAVSGFGFRLAERRIIGEVDRLAAARERFEEALLEGRTAALLEQDRTSLFTQELGNIPPGTDVVAEVVIDQRLRWWEGGGWEWRFPTVVAPRYLGAEGRVPDAERVTVDVADAPLDVRTALALVIRDALADGGRPESLSHAIRVAPGDGGLQVSLDGEPGAALDRDVVVRWPVARPRVGVALAAGRPAADCPHADAAYGLLTLVPPAPAHVGPAFPRDLIVLLDTSGSMSGTPLDQARRVVAALVESLGEMDRLELIAFADRPRRWRSHPAVATPAMRSDAPRWLETLEAGGGTEMGEAIGDALRPLRPDAQRQVVLVTDGLIGFETEIVASIIRDLPSGSRLHAVGVGSAVNRALTATAARAGRGAEVLVGLGEDAGAAAGRLVARTRAPLLTDLELGGSALVAHAPVRIPDVLAGGPVGLAVKLRPEGGEVHVRGRGPEGPWEARVAAPVIEPGAGNPALVALYGREAVEDLECRRVAGETEVDGAIERLGLDFQIATRLTSWVAVSEEPTVDPTRPYRRERVPHGLPEGLSAEGLGLRRASGISALAAFPVQFERLAPAPSSRADLSLPEEAVRRLRVGLRDAARHTVGDGRQGFGVAREGIREIEARALRKLREAARSLRLRDIGREGVATGSLTGRIVRRRERELVVEITVDREIAWDPTGADVVWPDGTRLVAVVDRRRTSRRGLLGPAQAIRLSLRLEGDGPAGAPARIVVAAGGPAPLTVDLWTG